MVESQVGQIMERAGIAFFWGGGHSNRQAGSPWMARSRPWSDMAAHSTCMNPPMPFAILSPVLMPLQQKTHLEPKTAVMVFLSRHWRGGSTFAWFWLHLLHLSVAKLARRAYSVISAAAQRAHSASHLCAHTPCAHTSRTSLEAGS